MPPDGAAPSATAGALGGVDDDLEEVRHARPPSRGNVVVQRVDVVLLHRRQVAPPGSRRHRRRRLSAALGVGQEDEVGLGLKNELSRELWIAPGLVLRGVGDVMKTGKLEKLADE